MFEDLVLSGMYAIFMWVSIKDIILFILLVGSCVKHEKARVARSCLFLCHVLLLPLAYNA
ncbi:unnamed protein product [Trifolium pratense]|uniref:Uncharacterized protein n=1 Tax=Trifolium pratense TaxID=57577 RepID=A0ACB0KM23_TRIPR|nr:unnamed protein product [Trifolium pratense]